MFEEIFALIYAAVVMGFVAWNIKKGSFVIDPSKLAIYALAAFLIIVASLTLGGANFIGSASAVMKLGAAGVLFAGTIPMITSGIGFLRFGDEYGPNIFYARNHITGVVDCIASLVMIFVGILIYRLDLMAVGFFFFLLIPYTGNALANAYYFSHLRMLNK